MRTARRRSPRDPFRVAPPSVDDPKVSRALTVITEAVNGMGEQTIRYVDVSLVVGTNRIEHGLMRTPVAVSVMPFTASAAFAWSFDPAQSGNPHPERVADVVVAGTAMRARVFFE